MSNLSQFPQVGQRTLWDKQRRKHSARWRGRCVSNLFLAW